MGVLLNRWLGGGNTFTQVVVKGVTFMVMLFFVLQYPAQALAEEVSVESGTSTTEVSSTTESAESIEESPESSVEGEIEFGLPGEGESQSMMSGVTDDGDVTSVENVSINGFKGISVDENYGALKYSYPIILPKGRGETTPNLVLNYSNQNSSDQDIFGYGWKLSIPQIEAINKIGSEKLYSGTSSENYFISSLSGELVRIGTSTSYRAKVENGDFLTYASSSSGWTVTDKVGNKYYFGTASSSRQDNASSTGQIARWMLAKVEDKNGNYATYTYSKDQGTIYPSTITYSHGTSTTGIFEVRFALATSSLNFKSYDKAYPITRAYKVSEIKMLVSGTEVRNYTLRYGNGSNGKRDLLLGITERGIENGSTTTMPETMFDYDTVAEPTWGTGDYTNTFPEPLDEKDIGVRFGDLNGDGLMDVVRNYEKHDHDGQNYDYHVQRVHINKGDGRWDYDVEWDWDDIIVPFNSMLDLSSNKYYNFGTNLVDVNGDGRDDYVVAYDGPSSYYSYNSYLPLGQIGVYINTGSGFKKDDSWTGLLAFTWWHEGRDDISNAANAFIDVNGDGLPDIVNSKFISQSNGSPHANTDSDVYINTGNGWTLDPNLTFPAPLGEMAGTVGSGTGFRNFKDVGTRVADVNGDGLVDVLRGYRQDVHLQDPEPEKDETSVYLNTGTGWATTSNWSLPDYFIVAESHAPSKGLNVVDINGDRLPDLISSLDYNDDTYKFYLNTGNGWTTEDYELPFFLNYGYGGHSNGVIFADFDGDTISDALNLLYDDMYETHATGGYAYINEAPIPDQLTSILLPYGGTLTMALDGYFDTAIATSSSIGTTTYNPVIVSQISYNSGFGNEWNTQFKYGNADSYYASTSLRDRQFTGFGKVTKIDDSATTTTYYHQGNGNATTSEELTDNVPKIGYSYRTEVRDTEGDLYKVEVSKYATSSLGNGAHFVKLERQTVMDYDGGAGHRDSAIEYTRSDSTGEVTEMIEWGRVSADDDGTINGGDVGTDKRTTTYNYAASSSAGILAIPSQQTTRNQDSATTSATRFIYDNRSFGSVDKGNLTKREHWVATSTYIDYEWSYSGYGLPITEKDPRDKTTTYVYDSFNLYPATTTNPLSQSTRYTYDYSAGKPKMVTDANSLTQTFVFDGLDRLIEEKVPDPSTGASSTKTTYTYNDATGTASVLTKTYRTASSSTDTYSYLDGFGREVQRRTTGEVSGQYITRDIVYGVGGLLHRESLPYFSTSSARTDLTLLGPLYTNYSYDALSRISKVETIVGSTDTSYDEWTQTVTDALGNEKDYQYDAYGRLIGVAEHNGTSTYETIYEWDHNNNLTKITDALNNVRNITYDGLSRRLTLEDLHDSGDATYGTWSFAYDQSGNLISKTDPKSQTVQYTYDDTNRPLTENYTGQTGTESRYTYDSCTRGIGRLCTAGSNSATTTYAYNYLGLPATTSRTISTTTYNTVETYDRVGNKTLIKYPDNSEVAYTYNAGNQIETVKQRESGGSWQDIITDLDYGPHGQVTYQKHGNGTETTKTYDSGELYRLRSIYTTASSTGMGGAGPEHAALEAELESLGLLDPEAQTEEMDAAAETEPALGEVLGTSTEDVSDEAATETTASSTDAAASSTASSTDETVTATTTATSTVDFGLASSSASSTELLEDVVTKTAVTTEPVASTTIELPIVSIDTKLTDNLITNAHEARAWQKFHEERVAGIATSKDAPPEALEAARYAKERFDTYLLEKGYVSEKGAPVKGQAKDYLEKVFKEVVENVISAILPERAYAYLFGAEDFESCSSLPCSFSNVSTWGSVTQSLDATSKVSGADSLREVVSGEGEGSLESVNHNEDEIWVQFKVFIPSSMNWGGSGYFSVLNFEDSSNSDIFWLTIEDWGTPRLTMGGDTLSWTDTGITLTEGAVNTIEVRFKKGSSTGDVDIWHNSTTEGSPTYNGSGSMNTGTDNVDDVRIGMTYAPETGISTTYYDDFIIDTSFIGEPEEEPTEPFDSVLQDLTYIYDAVGNITYIIDDSNASSTVYGYEYDDLYRLTKFGTTTASLTTVERDFGGSATLQPGSEGKDTYYGSTAATGGAPDSTILNIGGTGGAYEAFIEFDLSSVDFTDVESAEIMLFAGENYPAATNAKLLRATSSWTESGVTYGSHPGAADFGMSWQPIGANEWWVADVTELVEDWFDETHPNYGVKIVTQDGYNQEKHFKSSDYGTAAYHPLLFIQGVGSYDVVAVTGTSSLSAIQTYTYDALGNILTKSDVGAYEYGGGGSEVTLPIYTDSVAAGWSDWSWDTSLNPSNSSPVHNGTYSLRAGYGTAWAGMGYRNNSVDGSLYNELHLKVNVGTSTSANLYAYFTDQDNILINAVDLEEYVTGDFQANTWHDIEIPLEDLDFENYAGATTFTIESSATSTIYYDDIELVGSTGTPSYANPHAATLINGVTYAYDNNGNLTSAGSETNTWNYDNRLTQTAGGGNATTTYAYDAGGQRVTKTSNGITTRYPSNLYEVKATTTTKHIYVGDTLIATVDNTGTYHNHLDHLGSTAAVTNDASYLNQELAYYPFGSTRVSNQYGSLNQSNQYIGQNLDDETDLSYMNARYYEGSRGQFLSQDPSFLDIGSSWFQDKYKRPLPVHLMNPQALNSYSYALGNPIRYSDPSGEIVPVILGAWALAEIGLSAYDAYTAYQTINDPNASELEKSLAFGGFAAGLYAPGGGYGKLSSDAATRARQISNVANQANRSEVLQKAGVQVGYHGGFRMITRNISISSVENAVSKGQKFNYFHEGVDKVGYYDSKSKVFVGTVDGKVTTTIKTNDKYVENLKKKTRGSD